MTRRVTAREPSPAVARARGRGKAPPPRALLDVNVLIALLDVDHLHHRRCLDWLGAHIEAGWASCAITENGCVRTMSQPGYRNPLPTARVAERLAQATATDHHRYIAEGPSLLDPARFDTERLLGHRQVTDAWLLGVAVEHGLRLVTLDAQISLAAVRGATAAHLVVL